MALRRRSVVVLALGVLTISAVAVAQRMPEWVRHLQPLNTHGSLRQARPITEATAPNPAAQRTLALLERTVSATRTTRYNHSTIVDERTGRYEFDCSGLVAWTLARTAPNALSAIHSSRPVAAEIAATIARAPANGASRGWQRVTRIQDVRPGDVFAWRNPRWLHGLTGHTGFIVGPVEAVADNPTLFRARVTDSNSTGYEDDTRRIGTGGLGTGTVMFSGDPATGAITGIVVGHLGVAWVLPLPVVVGRVSS